MNFIAEIIRTSQRKLASNDNQYEVVLRSNNPMVLDLGKLPSDTLFEINVTLYSSTPKKETKEKIGYDKI
jgi:uncharacterized protein YjgD (DUF1641 family)